MTVSSGASYSSMTKRSLGREGGLLGRRIHVRSGMFMDDKLVSSYLPGLTS